MRGRWICPSPNTLKTFLWQSPPYSWRSNFKIYPVAVCWTCPLFRQETGLLWRERDKFHGSRSWISFYSRRVRRLKYSSFIFIFKICCRPEFHITTRDFYIYQHSHERRWFTKISDRFLNFFLEFSFSHFFNEPYYLLLEVINIRCTIIDIL